MVNKKKAIDSLSVIYCILVLTFIYAPILLLMIYSFNSAKVIGEEGSFSLKWYIALFQSEKVVTILINTVVLAFIAATLSTILGTAGAIGNFCPYNSGISDAFSRDRKHQPKEPPKYW